MLDRYPVLLEIMQEQGERVIPLDYIIRSRPELWAAFKVTNISTRRAPEIESDLRIASARRLAGATVIGGSIRGRWVVFDRTRRLYCGSHARQPASPRVVARPFDRPTRRRLFSRSPPLRRVCAPSLVGSLLSSSSSFSCVAVRGGPACLEVVPEEHAALHDRPRRGWRGRVAEAVRRTDARARVPHVLRGSARRGTTTRKRPAKFNFIGGSAA